MLDIKFIREHKDVVQAGADKKHIEIKIDDLIALDDKRRILMSEIELLRAKQNKANQTIATSTDKQREKYIETMQKIKKEIQDKEAELKPIQEEWTKMMYKVPIMPDISVPAGKGEEENVSIKEWGTKPSFNFEAKDHVALTKDLDLADFERGAKVHGFRGYFLKGDGANLIWALLNHARAFYTPRGFTPFMAPSVVRKDNFYKTGHLPNEAEDLYFTQDDDYLSGTAEVPMMAYHSDEILSHEDLPIKILAFSPCYRREAGSYGKDTKGLFRVHEFLKIEQLILCEANYETGMKHFEELNTNYEEFLESLKLPYQRLLICGGDLSGSKVKQYDTEAWLPSENTYRELSSVSYYSDYQTRRFNIRYRDPEGKIRFAHSLNCTAVATPRILTCLLENNQQSDGSVHIPESLQKYMNKEKITGDNGRTEGI